MITASSGAPSVFGAQGLRARQAPRHRSRARELVGARPLARIYRRYGIHETPGPRRVPVLASDPRMDTSIGAGEGSA